MKNILIALCLLTSMTQCEQEMPRLLIKIPTRSRPELFFKRLDLYYEGLSGVVPYHFLISCDVDDATMNNREIITKLETYDNLSFYFGNNYSKVEAYNADMNKYNDWDIVLVVSDDMVPVTQGYDIIIATTMQKYFPDYDGILNFHDGHVMDALNTYPVIGRTYFNRFGFIYNPVYKALFCDSELTYISRALGKEALIPSVLINHYHPIWNLADWDELYIKNEAIGSKVDAYTYAERRAKNFYLTAENSILWSILICTLEERKPQFNTIYNKLKQQINALGLQEHVEILYFRDKREHSVGYKRTALVEQSNGQYVCFIDDDDDVHPAYIQMIYNALQTKPDCVSLVGIITSDGGNPKTFIHSLQYNAWFEENNVYYRCPNHLNPVKRSIAIQFPYPKKNIGEDWDWSMAVAQSGLLQTEAVIEEPYYFYQYITK